MYNKNKDVKIMLDFEREDSLEMENQQISLRKKVTADMSCTLKDSKKGSTKFSRFL